MGDERRLTRKKERHALYLAADGKCELCGVDLPNDWHADHIVPFSVSGKTHYTEMQALCPSCNLKKGCSVMSSSAASAYKLRLHQQTLKDKLDQVDHNEFQKAIRDHGAFLILANVVPGGGKTKLGLILAKRFMDLNILVVVPRRSLGQQAEKDFKKDGVDLYALLNGWENNPIQGTRGIICTHAMVSGNAQNIALAMARSRKKWAVIVDECHHLRKNPGDECWEDGDFANISAAEIRKHIYSLDCVDLIMRMSGTFSTKTDLIDGVDYVEVEDKERDTVIYEPDWEMSADIYVDYSRRDALKEGAIVPVKFYHVDGEAEYLRNGQVLGDEISTDNEKDSRRVLRASVTTEYGHQMVKEAMAHYSGHIKTFPKAKMIVVCASQKSAKDVISLIGDIAPSCACFLAISENDKALEDIERFKKTAGNSVLVTVGMAYEGLDVPDVSHLVGLTIFRTDGWIHQMLARAWRKTDWKNICHIWVPDDLMMRRIIRLIKEEEICLTEISNEPCYPRDPRGGEGGAGEEIIPLSSNATHLFQGHLDDDAGVVGVVTELVQHITASGIDDDSGEIKELLAAKARGQIGKKKKIVQDRNKYDDMTVREKREHLRKFISNFCHMKNAGDHGVTEGRMVRRYWSNGIENASLSALESACNDIKCGRFK